MSNLNKVLIVDDEPDILEIISYNLLQENMEIFTASNGIEAIQQAKACKPNLILLDINMPQKDGLLTCTELRKLPEFNDTIIVFLTANTDENTEILGLNIGADDYISKPIKPRVLVSRVKALLRRANIEDNGDMVFEKLTIHKERYTVTLEGTEILLARKEFELLALLASKPSRVFDRNEILQTIWGNDVIVGDRTIDVHVRKIRQKLNDGYIFTVKGVGYKFEA